MTENIDLRIEELKENTLKNLKSCFRAINIWLFVWPLWISYFKYSKDFSIAMVVVYFLILFVILWGFSLWFKVKRSPASAYTWFWVNIWFALSFVLSHIERGPGVLPVLDIIIASVFFYYFNTGINASKILKKFSVIPK